MNVISLDEEKSTKQELHHKQSMHSLIDRSAILGSQHRSDLRRDWDIQSVLRPCQHQSNLPVRPHLSFKQALISACSTSQVRSHRADL